jgi:hypothetical protein
MVEKENLFEIFSRFPTQKHGIEICKLGQKEKTCRYLFTDSTKGWRWGCIKTNNLRKLIETRVKNNETSAKGDNCEGLLGLIIKEQQKLKGRKVIYIRPYCQITSNLKKIEIEDNIFRIVMEWENKRKLEFAFDIDDLDIIVNSQGIDFFQNLNKELGENFIKQFTIFF